MNRQTKREKFCVNRDPVALVNIFPNGRDMAGHDMLQMGDKWVMENNNAIGNPFELFWGAPNKAHVRRHHPEEKGRCNFPLGEAKPMKTETAKEWADGWEKKNPLYHVRQGGEGVNCQDLPRDFVLDPRHKHLNLDPAKLPPNQAKDHNARLEERKQFMWNWRMEDSKQNMVNWSDTDSDSDSDPDYGFWIEEEEK